MLLPGFACSKLELRLFLRQALAMFLPLAPRSVERLLHRGQLDNEFLAGGRLEVGAQALVLGGMSRRLDLLLQCGTLFLLCGETLLEAFLGLPALFVR
ncbi:MAG: hypothetical protein ACXW19_11220, partial [Thermoanaerobaculia bacterium]